jgi:hypothetical protein
MSERILALAQLLPDKSSLDDYTLEELQHIAKRYPYFAPAQFLLVQKMKDAAVPEAAAQQQKASLYYNDPVLFDFFISPDRFFIEEQVHSLVDNTSVQASAISNAYSEYDATGPEQSQFMQYETEPSDLVHDTIAVQEPIFVPIEETSEEPSFVGTETNSQLNESFPEPDKVNEIDSEAGSEPIVLPVQDLKDGLLTEEHIEVPQTGTTEPAEVALPVMPDKPEEKVSALTLHGEAEPANSDGNGTELSEAATVTTSALTVRSEALGPSSATEPLSFEPFHTVDYFASQGIRITTDELPKDKLSKQLRSFTEWLKMMKRLPAAEAAKSPETVAEKSVESLAIHSVEGSDVVTEAMAEVWARQGNRQKAIETYNKLSLLNPSKRTYFAAKIENLS